jgi:hypothetical protein
MTGRRVTLSSAEAELWRRLTARAWQDLQQAFPRLRQYSGPVVRRGEVQERVFEAKGEAEA